MRVKRCAIGWRYVDEVELAAQLRAGIEGDVRFDAGSRALYATDGSNYRQVPIGVVLPSIDGRHPPRSVHCPAIRRANPRAGWRHEFSRTVL